MHWYWTIGTSLTLQYWHVYVFMLLSGASPTQGLLDDDEKSVDSYEAAGSRPGSSLGDEDNSFPR